MSNSMPPDQHTCGPTCQHESRIITAAGLAHDRTRPPILDAALQGTSLEPDFLPLDGRRVDPQRRILIRGGTILSMDPKVGDFARGDLLIEGHRIAAVQSRIEADAVILDAEGMIIIPGFCDPHIHAWQGNLARLIPDNTSSVLEESGGPMLDPHPTRSYRHVMHQIFGPAYRPQDMYAGTLMTMLAALNGGITTVCDNAHNSRSPAHSDASIAALHDAGIRGVHAYGRPRLGEWGRQFPQDIHRLRKSYFASDDQLTTLRFYMLGRDNLNEMNEVLRIRRELDLWITFDSGIGVQPIDQLYADGRFSGKETINHGNFVPREKMVLLAEHGAKVNVCPRIESQFRYGDVPYQAWRDVGVKPAISNDDPATYAINMFHEMQVLYSFQRAQVHRARMRGDAEVPALVGVRDMLEAATLRGAENCGLDHKVGSLTPGKEADIVLIDARNPHLFPMHHAACTTVQGADVGFVDSVFVAGRLMKWRGQLLGIDLPQVMREVEASRDYLFDAVKWPLARIDMTH